MQVSRKLYRVGNKFLKFKKMISDVREKGNYIEVFDDNGKKISYMNTSNKEIEGITGDFFVVTNGNYIEVYDEDCKKISYMNVSSKTITAVAGHTFTVRNGNYLETYDKKCKKLSSKNA